MAFKFRLTAKDLYTHVTLRAGDKVPPKFMHLHTAKLGRLGTTRFGLIPLPRMAEWERQYQIPFHVDIYEEPETVLFDSSFDIPLVFTLYAADHAMLFRLAFGGESL